MPRKKTGRFWPRAETSVKPLIMAISMSWCLAIASPFTRAEVPYSVLVHPLFTGYYTCSEHSAGQLPALGDALGQDCHVQAFHESEGRVWLRSYRSDGMTNEDWYGWRAPVQSPCKCQVTSIRENPITNEPGVLGKPPATIVILRREDGVQLALGHVRELRIEVGDQVEEGQVIGRVGNNGYSRSPHVHIGAWRDKEPLQIRFDQTKMRKRVD